MYILGPAVKDFEKQMQEYLQVKHAIGCANGTDALVLALKALKLRKVTKLSPHLFIFATASCIYRVGAKPIFVDINEKTFNINPDLIENQSPKTLKQL